jgi:hypothetical protein
MPGKRQVEAEAAAGPVQVVVGQEAEKVVAEGPPVVEEPQEAGAQPGVEPELGGAGEPKVEQAAAREVEGARAELAAEAPVEVEEQAAAREVEAVRAGLEEVGVGLAAEARAGVEEQAGAQEVAEARVDPEQARVAVRARPEEQRRSLENG